MGRPDFKKTGKSSGKKEGGFRKKFASSTKATAKRNTFPKQYTSAQKVSDPNLIRLNKYVANSGVCSRRDADIYIESGNVSVNGKVITEMGYKVHLSDTVKFDGRELNPEKKEYILLNKPKDFVTTTTDDKGRRTTVGLIGSGSKAKLEPVGRLDKKTTGLLLFTNDLEMAKRLMQPKNGVRKIYQVELNKNVSGDDLKNIEKGITLDDTVVRVAEVSFIENATKREIGIEIRSAKSRIVHRIFEQLGYEVVKIDRVVYAGLTKKDLPRGHWRHLTKQELINIGMIK